MKNLKARVLAMLLALSIVLSGSAIAVAIPGDGETNDSNILALYEVGVFKGDQDGKFRPDDVLSAAEAAALYCRAFLLERNGDNNIPALSAHWAYDYLMACLDNGVQAFAEYNPSETVKASAFLEALTVQMEDYTTSYSTGDTLTRSEAAAILCEAVNTPCGHAGATYLEVLEAERIIEEAEYLRYFALASYYEDNMIHAVAVSDEPDAYIYDSRYRGFIKTDAVPENVIYNFTAVMDTTGDQTGDVILIVSRDDSESYWDSEMHYSDPAFSNVNNIPFGERLLGFDPLFNGAIVDYYNITTPDNPYYYTYDWYNSTSTDTLTLLTGFKTFQQSTSWACGVTSAIMVMEWFGMRGGLNELDLGELRDARDKNGNHRWGGATDVQMLINAFSAVNDMEGTELWAWDSTYDFVDGDGNISENYLSTAWIEEMLSQGRPVLVGWNSFGAHWQVIIGYDNMGTETTADDVLILADPYDTTDQLNDGYNIQSYERLYWDWTQNFDRDFKADNGYGMTVMFAPYPVDYEASAYAPVTGSGLVVKIPAASFEPNSTEDMLIPYGKTAGDLAASDYTYAKEQIGENGLSGPASSDYYRQFQNLNSPYYPQIDFYGSMASDISESLILLEGFQTSQQASEWTCGPSSLRMVLNWYGLMDEETEFSLAQLREEDKEGATTLDGMIQIFEALDLGFTYFSSDDLDEDGSIGGYNLYDGASYDGLIPYCLKNGIPVIIGWDEWGGHWQVVIGYDDMGVEDTQCDVLILADPYDTTDHLQDGYVIESFERLLYGWGSLFDPRGETVFLIAAPADTLSAVFAS